MEHLESDLITFSIIVPCYNQGHFLKDCFNSILNQKFRDWEVILVNDGSIDTTQEIAESFVNRDSRVSCLFQENKGLSAARNTGMAKAKGQYLLFLDADDWVETDFFTNIQESITKNKGFELYSYGYGYWDKPQGHCYHYHNSGLNGEIYPSVLTRNIGPCHAQLIERKFANQLGGFDPSLKSCEDWDFWIRAGKMGARLKYTPIIGVGYRYVPSSMSRNPKVMYKSLSEVSKRASKVDQRLSLAGKFNIATSLNLIEERKNFFFQNLGVMIHKNQVAEALEWFENEKQKNSWVIRDADFYRMSTYLTWQYFNRLDLIEKLEKFLLPSLNQFFDSLGVKKSKSKKIIRQLLKSQLMIKNHLKYGRILGGTLNRLKLY